MNLWTYLNANPVGAVVLVLAIGWTVRGIIAAARARPQVKP